MLRSEGSNENNVDKLALSEQNINLDNICISQNPGFAIALKWVNRIRQKFRVMDGRLGDFAKEFSETRPRNLAEIDGLTSKLRASVTWTILHM
jgi:hypothetical protein